MPWIVSSFRLIFNNPAALESYLVLSGALNKGGLPAPTRERIALAAAEINGCNYYAKASSFGCRRRTVGRQALDGENDDAHGHEERVRNLSLLGHRDEC